MAKVSVIMATFNRADTIVRAIRSVRNQTFQDWELIVIDDGSTDGTAELIAGMEARLVLIRQPNRGFTEARNVGIRAGIGRYFAFLDSDDEFLPHYLELCVAFLDAHPDELYVSTELTENFGHERSVSHYRTEVSKWYPQKAAVIGSSRFDLPAGELDDYLRVYATREAVGEWGGAIVKRVAADQPVFLYRGSIFDYLRYDFLITITATVFRAKVFDELGLPETRWSKGSDFHFLARLCRFARTNYISLTSFVKHEYAENGDLPACGHVVSGPSMLSFIEEWHRAWDDLFWNPNTTDPELRGLRSFRQFWMAEMALKAGNRAVTLYYLRNVMAGLPTFRKARVMYWVVWCMPTVSLSQRGCRAFDRIIRAWQWLVTARVARSEPINGAELKSHEKAPSCD